MTNPVKHDNWHIRLARRPFYGIFQRTNKIIKIYPVTGSHWIKTDKPMLKSAIYCSYSLALLFLFYSCQTAPEKASFDPIELRERLHQVVDKHELMGMAVLLLSDGEVLWQSNYGLANRATNKPVDKNTLFRVASISKTVTATAVMQLVEAGKLDLEEDVSTYLGWELKHPQYPKTPITLRLLMSHRSGIRDGSGYGPFSRDMIVKQLNIKELLNREGAYFKEDMFGDTAPGDFFFYTNCTWGLIASIIEKVSGERFDAYCQKHIFPVSYTHLTLPTTPYV